MNCELTEVIQVDDANLVYIVDDHRGLGFTNGMYYPIYEKYDELYLLDNLGYANAAVFCSCKIKFYQCSNFDKIHSFIIDNKDKYIEQETLRASMVTNNAIEWKHRE